jgi:hypothetical protein
MQHKWRMTNAYKMYSEKLKGRGRAGHKWEDNIKWILNEKGVRVCTELIWARVTFCERDNETS